jgi:hypothetical protein
LTLAIFLAQAQRTDAFVAIMPFIFDDAMATFYTLAARKTIKSSPSLLHRTSGKNGAVFG